MTLEETLRSMVEFLDEYPDCGYSKKDIAKCSKILVAYEKSMQKIKKSGDLTNAMAAVEKVILDLNDLNEKTDYALIETDQREDLCAFIDEKAAEAGLDVADGDIGGEWREW